jgi:hypothetical protein
MLARWSRSQFSAIRSGYSPKDVRRNIYTANWRLNVPRVTSECDTGSFDKQNNNAEFQVLTLRNIYLHVVTNASERHGFSLASSNGDAKAHQEWS